METASNPFPGHRGVGYQVLMLQRRHRNLLPDHRSYLSTVKSTRIDDDFTAQIALVGSDDPFLVSTIAVDISDRIEATDFGPGFSSISRQGLRQLAWVDVTFVRIKYAANNGVTRRIIGMHRFHFGRS